jgi:hypothetical protein
VRQEALPEVAPVQEVLVRVELEQVEDQPAEEAEAA